MITKYIVGDITQTELKYIAHGVNCKNKMGSGVAKALYEKFPAVKEEYHALFDVLDLNRTKYDTILGITRKVFSGDKVIYNCFTQENYGYDGKRYVNYNAVARCFESVVRGLRDEGNPIIAIPKIGCGLAGGNWEFMEQLINDTVGDKLEIWVYELEEKKV